MTTLNTIIEEEKKEFDRRTDASNYEMAEMEYGTIKIGSDTLLDESWYPESSYEIDGEKVKDFLATAMQRAYEAGANNERASWLRSEIEKLEQRQLLNVIIPTKSPLEHALREREHNVLTSIITRYKEELLELEKGV